MTGKPYQQGDIWWVRLDPGSEGNETRGNHACVILQNNIINECFPTVIIAPLLKVNSRKAAPYLVKIDKSPTNGLDVQRYVDLTQIRAVEQKRFLNKKGTLEPRYWPMIQGALAIITARMEDLEGL